MKYNIPYVFIKSNWFDPNKKNPIAKKITADGLLVYLTLFKFRLHNPNKNENVFITSIGLLSKELPKKYTKDKIYELLRLLQRSKVIKINNISNFNNQVKTENGKIDHDKVLVIEAVDYPKTKRENGQDIPITEDDYFIAVHMPMVDAYLNKFNLDEKFICLYVLMNKYNDMNGFYMKIEKMERVTGIDKNTINRMIWELNELKLLASYKQKKDGNKYVYYHHICRKADNTYYQKFLDTYGNIIDKMTKEIQKKRRKKEDNSNDITTVYFDDVQDDEVFESFADDQDNLDIEFWGYDSNFGDENEITEF